MVVMCKADLRRKTMGRWQAARCTAHARRYMQNSFGVEIRAAGHQTPFIFVGSTGIVIVHTMAPYRHEQQLQLWLPMAVQPHTPFQKRGWVLRYSM